MYAYKARGLENFDIENTLEMQYQQFFITYTHKTNCITHPAAIYRQSSFKINYNPIGSMDLADHKRALHQYVQCVFSS